MAEQGTVNPWVVGSIPTSPAMTKKTTQMIDDAIKLISGRELLSASEMTDILLDIRLQILLDEELLRSNQ